MNSILQSMSLVVSDWQSFLVGGIVVVGVVMFLMGVLKSTVFDRIKNKMLRKTLLSFVSVILVAPSTAVYMFSKGWEWSWGSFMILYMVNTVATVVFYWFYEGTHLRELLSLIGKNTVMKWVNVLKGGGSLVEVAEEVDKHAVQQIKNAEYDEEDLKDL